MTDRAALLAHLASLGVQHSNPPLESMSDGTLGALVGVALAAREEFHRSAIVAEARSWIGTPYRHQASVKHVGCDCLGLVRGVWRALYGKEPEPVPAYAPDWAEASGHETLLEAGNRHMSPVPVPSARPGDVLLFRWRPNLPAKHCAILATPLDMGGGRIIHAYDAAGRVAEVNFAHAWKLRCVAAFRFPMPGVG